MTNETFHPQATTIILRRRYSKPVTFADLRAAYLQLGCGPNPSTKWMDGHEPAHAPPIRHHWSAALKQVAGALDEVYAMVDGREVRVAVVSSGHAFEVVGEADKLIRVLVDSLLTEADEQGYWERPHEIRMDLASASSSLEATPIQRIDYSEPPPGYERRVLGSSVQAPLVSRPTPLAHATVPLRESIRRGADFEWFATEAEGRADAWSRYKAHNDPPGLTEIFRCGGLVDGEVVRGWKFRFGIASDEVLCPDREAARAAAWAWYDRRLALAEHWRSAYDSAGDARVLAAVRYQGCGDGMVFDDWWPRCLTWSDEQVAEVERWLVDNTMELPEVLGGSAPGDPNADDPPGTYSPIETSAAADDGPHVCMGCIGDGPCVALEAEIKGRDWNRQMEEHNATTLPLLNFSAPPPGYEVDCYPHEKASDPPTSFGVALTGARPLCLFADEGEAVAAAWSDYKLSHDPPGMWCGFSRSVDDLDNCSIRVGVHACGARWELQPDITVPYDGFLVKAREWAWAWYERRRGLMAKIPTMVTSLRADRRGPYPSRALAQRLAFAQRLVDRAPFHRVLCWHDEWVAEVEAWIEHPSPHLPEALR